MILHDSGVGIGCIFEICARNEYDSMACIF